MKLKTVADICPDPSILKREDDFQGWNSDHPLFADLIQQTSPRTIIEVGTWKGASALHMAELTRHLDTKIYCVDTWLGSVEGLRPEDLASDEKEPCLYRVGDVYFQFLHNVCAKGCQHRIYPVPHTSSNGARLLSYLGVKADLIYIDADHYYEGAFSDLEFYAGLLAPAGVMFGDDFNDFPGVRMAVMRFAFERNLRVTTHGPAWVLHRKSKLGAL